MESVIRRSAVSFDAVPVKTEERDGWSVVLEYEDEGPGPYVVDLSHRPRWDLQDGQVGVNQTLDIPVPSHPGQCVFDKGFLINRMNRTQASVWHLVGTTPDLPEDPACTEVTDATVFLSIFGPDLFSILEKLSALDFLDPTRKEPFLLQGRSGILMTVSRGYGRDMVNAILGAGAEFNLRPAGEQAFSEWLAAIS
jgi:hypothetical protein